MKNQWKSLENQWKSRETVGHQSKFKEKQKETYDSLGKPMKITAIDGKWASGNNRKNHEDKDILRKHKVVHLVFYVLYVSKFTTTTVIGINIIYIVNLQVWFIYG